MYVIDPKLVSRSECLTFTFFLLTLASSKYFLHNMNLKYLICLTKFLKEKKIKNLTKLQIQKKMFCLSNYSFNLLES